MLGEQRVVSLGPSGSDDKDLGAAPSELPELPNGGTLWPPLAQSGS